MANVADLKVRSNDYWKDRAERIEKSIFEEGENSLKDLKKLFSKTYKEMNGIVAENYSKYGKIVESPTFSTLADGTQVISGYSSKLALDKKTMDMALAKGTRMDKLIEQLNESLLAMSKEQNQLMISTLSPLAERAFYETMFETYKGLGVGTQFNLLTKTQIMSLIKNPVNGLDFSERVWKNRKLLESQVNEVIKAGITQGIPNKEMAKRLAAKMDSGYKVAERLINTEVSNSLNQGTLLSYEQSGIVKQYQYLTTLDKWTSNICNDLDAKVFDLKDAVVGLNLPPMHPNCFDKKTKVYTDKGWMLFDDLTGEETFASVNPDDITQIEYIKAKVRIKYNYQGDMIHFVNRSFDMVVTPNHQMLVKYVKADSSGKYRFVDAEKMSKHANSIYRGMPNNNAPVSSFKLGNYDIEPELYLKFMAWYLSDGNATKIKDKNSYRVKIAQKTHLDLMYDVLKKLPFNVTKIKEAINIYDYSVCSELHKLGKCDKKYIPDAIKNVSTDQAKLFLEAYAIADGHQKKGKVFKGYQFKDTYTFFTTSDRLASDLGHMIWLSGGRPSFKQEKSKVKIVKFKNGDYTMNHNVWIISLCTSVNASTDNIKTEIVPYDDFVYCVELEKWHTLMTRRKGKVAWSGNCRSTTIAYFDESTDGLTRIARDLGGKSFLVPGDMAYKEFKSKYID